MQILLWGLVLLFGFLWYSRYASRSKKARNRQ
jgi:hypothetical protein